MKKALMRMCAMLLVVYVTGLFACYYDGAGYAPVYTTADGDEEAEAEAEAEAEPEFPDPSGFFEVRTHETAAMTDVAYPGEETTYFRTTDKLFNLDVRSLALIGGTLYAGTAGGVARYEAGSGALVKIDALGDDPVVAIARTATSTGLVAVAREHGVTLYDPAAKADPQVIALPDITVLSLAVDGDDVYVGAIDHFGVISGGNYSNLFDSPVNGVGLFEVRNLLVSGGAVYAATNVGLLYYKDATPTWIDDTGMYSAVALCGDGSILAGGDEKLLTVNGTTISATLLPEAGSLPYGYITSLTCGNDWRLLGHQMGATALATDGSHKDYYGSMRYLLDMHVNDVALEQGGHRWIATAAGITRVGMETTTLWSKAESNEELLNQLFWRLGGFVSSDAGVSSPWDLSSSSLWDKDNDGLWTQMMIGGWCFAYGVTGDTHYCDQARKAMANIIMLQELPCITFTAQEKDCGFIARSFVREDEGAVYTSKIDEAEKVVKPDGTYKDQLRWQPVEYEGQNYLWKSDTSSDEYAGHFFAFPLYYDLCATEAEKTVIAEVMDKAVRYIVEGGYELIDLDGTPTYHGHWAPETIGACPDGFAECLNTAEDPMVCEDACYGGGWLNSMEMMGMLLSTYHVTGDSYFYEKYRMLVDDYYYAKIATFSDNVFTATRRAIQNHSDHELAMLATHSLIRYELDETQRDAWIESMLAFYDTERPERHPLWSAFVAGLGGEDYQMAESLQTMQEIHRDQREWRYDNSHRKDYTVDRAKDRHNHVQFTTVPPYDERAPIWWNTNTYGVESGGNGYSLNSPTAYLLAYWSMRYYGLLEGPEEDK